MKSVFSTIIALIAFTQIASANMILCESKGTNSYFEIYTESKYVLNSSRELDSKGLPKKIYSRQNIDSITPKFLESLPPKIRYVIKLEDGSGTIIVDLPKNGEGTGNYNGTLSGNEDVPLTKCSK